MSDRFRCVLLFGAPGVGKGTQGRRLGREDGFLHLATGDMFRGLDRESPEGQEFVSYSTRGMLVPDELTIRIWLRHVHELIETGVYCPHEHILLLDGMPRSLAQAEALDAHIEPLCILHLIAGDLDKMVQRMINRGREEGRADDVDESIVRHRFDVYDSETKPVLAHYDPKLVSEIDAMGSIDEVFDEVCAAVLPVRRQTA